MTVDVDVRAWLRRRGAATIAHPGGTLYGHLCRVQERLAALGHGDDVHLAGLAHAVYGTDGFDIALLDRTDRATLRNLIGDDAETLVYRYGACDRRRSWRQLVTTREVVDRFTGQVDTLGPGDLTPFVDLSIVNELDVIEHDPSVADKHGRYFREVFGAWAPAATASLMGQVHRILGE